MAVKWTLRCCGVVVVPQTASQRGCEVEAAEYASVDRLVRHWQRPVMLL